MKKLALLAVFLTLPVFSQTAKVIALNPKDAKYAQELDARQKVLDFDRQQFKQHIELEYIHTIPKLTDPGHNDSLGCMEGLYRRGWVDGFEFSEDWLYIVPLTPPTSGLISCGAATPFLTFTTH